MAREPTTPVAADGDGAASVEGLFAFPKESGVVNFPMELLKFPNGLREELPFASLTQRQIDGIIINVVKFMLLKGPVDIPSLVDFKVRLASSLDGKARQDAITAFINQPRDRKKGEPGGDGVPDTAQGGVT